MRDQLEIYKEFVRPFYETRDVAHNFRNIETLGAFGIAKAFTMGGVLGQTYEETADYFENQSLGKTEFRTPAGRRLSDEGRQYALDFLGRLRREW